MREPAPGHRLVGEAEDEVFFVDGLVAEAVEVRAEFRGRGRGLEEGAWDPSPADEAVAAASTDLAEGAGDEGLHREAIEDVVTGLQHEVEEEGEVGVGGVFRGWSWWRTLRRRRPLSWGTEWMIHPVVPSVGP